MKIQFRRDTTTNWNSANPILLEGEISYNTTNKGIKVGNGTHTWASLEYVSLTTETQTISGGKIFSSPIQLYKQDSTPASLDNAGQLYTYASELMHMDTTGVIAQLTKNGNPYREIAQVRLTMVDTTVIKLAPVDGLAGLLYINGEFCNLASNIRTVNHIATMLNTDGTDTTSPTQADTLLHVYASNSLITSMPNEIRTSVFSSNVNKYLGTEGDAQNWRLVGWVYAPSVSGTPYFTSNSTVALVCSKWYPRRTYVAIPTYTTTHVYTTAAWRKWNNAENTLLKYLVHEDHVIVPIKIQDTKSTSNTNNTEYGRSCVSFDSTDGISNMASTYIMNGDTTLTKMPSHGTMVHTLTPDYHYSYAVQYGHAQSLRYLDVVYQIGLMM